MRGLTAHRSPLRRRLADQDGSGPIPMAAGFIVFLLFLLLAVQTLLHLFATSTAGTAAFDGARRVATGQFACDTAVDHVRGLLGAWGTRTDVQVTCTVDDTATVRVAGPSPANLLDGFASLSGTNAVDRQSSVRIEVIR